MRSLRNSARCMNSPRRIFHLTPADQKGGETVVAAELRRTVGSDVGNRSISVVVGVMKLPTQPTALLVLSLPDIFSSYFLPKRRCPSCRWGIR